MSIVRFLNGTAQQQAWFKEAIDQAWPEGYDPSHTNSGIWAALQVKVSVEWVVDPGAPGAKENAYTTWWYGAMGLEAKIQIMQDLDNPSSQFYKGKNYYKEICLHEVGHIAAAKTLEANGRTGDAVALLSPRVSWEIGVPFTSAWPNCDEETAAELFKDGHTKAGQHAFLNRTNQSLHPSGPTTLPPGGLVTVPVEWKDWCDLYDWGEVQAYEYPPILSGDKIDYLAPMTITAPSVVIPDDGTLWNKNHACHIHVVDAKGAVVADHVGSQSFPGHVTDGGGNPTGSRMNGVNVAVAIDTYEWDRPPFTVTAIYEGFISGPGTPWSMAYTSQILPVLLRGGNPMYPPSAYPAMSAGAQIVVTSNS